MSDSTSNIKVLPDGSLSIAKVDASMEGSYTCEASNDFGTPLSKTIFVSVRGIYRWRNCVYSTCAEQVDVNFYNDFNSNFNFCFNLVLYEMNLQYILARFMYAKSFEFYSFMYKSWSLVILKAQNCRWLNTILEGKRQIL